MSNESAFITSTPDATSCWRAIVLFGRNTASYKFALASALLEARSAGIEFIKLDDLALPFSRALCRHIGENPRQGTMTRSRFLDACQSFNRGECSEDQLRAITVRDGFSDVLDAFHIVNQRVVPYRFFIDERAGSRGIRLTEECTKLLDHRRDRVVARRASSTHHRGA
jgi:hypothetical protein